ncbi:aldo/keto reductase [Streptomyces sp. GbtcB6]|uniref:aldo/keto reductase n=1 Tax=Streptomyces sp. GbtcB6 TaxID=2824751 RepID=UPI001C301FE2|nr:aldo/keto reductase [Streptomyces sp. GbtcB6]
MPHSPLELLGQLLDQRGAESSAHRFVLGGPFGSEPLADSFARLGHFTDAGGLLVETSHSYARGRAEAAVGEWLRKNPGRLGVVTKVGHDQSGHDMPLSRENVLDHVRGSLESLGVEAVDILLYHCDDPARPVAELADTLVSLVEAGYARRIGVSNWSAGRLAALAGQLAERGHTAVASYQFSLAKPDPVRLNHPYADEVLLSVVRRHGLPLLGWSAQARGFFARPTGGVRHDGRPDPFDTEQNRARRERCGVLAEQLDSRPETVALAWTLHHQGVWPSIGPRTTEQIDRSLRARRLSLTDEQVHWLQYGT